VGHCRSRKVPRHLCAVLPWSSRCNLSFWYYEQV